MKALSLTQPWATAVAIGIKQYETRSWPTGFRGEVAIHAAKGFPAWAREFADEESLVHQGLGELPLGAIVCVCHLEECVRTEKVSPSLTSQEMKWGDYHEGRFAYRLSNIRQLNEPIPVKGALGFWQVPAEIEQQIREQLA